MDKWIGSHQIRNVLIVNEKCAQDIGY
jgi:hypothetical protein